MLKVRHNTFIYTIWWRQSSRRFKIKLNYNIYATVDSLTGPDNDLLTLTRNIEANLRDYIAMGGYNYDAQELYIELPSTDIVQIVNDTNINLTSKITMTIDLYLGDN